MQTLTTQEVLTIAQHFMPEETYKRFLQRCEELESSLLDEATFKGDLDVPYRLGAEEVLRTWTSTGDIKVTQKVHADIYVGVGKLTPALLHCLKVEYPAFASCGRDFTCLRFDDDVTLLELSGSGPRRWRRLLIPTKLLRELVNRSTIVEQERDTKRIDALAVLARTHLAEAKEELARYETAPRPDGVLIVGAQTCVNYWTLFLQALLDGEPLPAVRKRLGRAPTLPSEWSKTSPRRSATARAYERSQLVFE